MILVISSPNDEHATAVLSRLEQAGATAALLDLSQFPREVGLTMSYDNHSAHKFALTLPGPITLHLEECRVIWWRRPQPFQLHPEIQQDSHRTFAYNEAYEAVSGLWQALDAFWINHPTRDEVASRKAYQLRVAQETGLTIPATLITNRAMDARAFAATHGHESTVYKAFSATEQEWRETRVLQAAELDLLDNVRYAPVIFQEYIPAKVDLRVSVVGDRIFAAAVESQETSYKVDYRMDMARARLAPFSLPSEVEERLHALMRRLGLVYGAIDMRLTPDERFIFLEINPSGQWLFIEERTGQPITEAFVQLLAKHDA